MECALLMLSLRGPLGPWQSPGTIYRTAPQKQAMVPGDCRVASLLAMTESLLSARVPLPTSLRSATFSPGEGIAAARHIFLSHQNEDYVNFFG